jgi:hypothetical protein
MSGTVATLLSILMLAAFALGAGGTYVLTAKRDRKKGGLMLLCALVLLGNVLVWTL